jgi:hypothetical protein
MPSAENECALMLARKSRRASVVHAKVICPNSDMGSHSIKLVNKSVWLYKTHSIATLKNVKLKGEFSFLVSQGALFFTLTQKYDFRFSRMLSLTSALCWFL